MQLMLDGCRRIRCVVLFLLPLWGCQGEESDHFQGYVEGEYVLVAAPRGGQLEQLLTVRGAEVIAGQPLFILATWRNGEGPAGSR